MFDLNDELKESSTYVFFKFLTKGHFTAFLAVKWAFLGKPVYRISLNNVRGHKVIWQFQKFKNLNNILFSCTKLFQKRGHYSRGDIIVRK